MSFYFAVPKGMWVDLKMCAWLQCASTMISCLMMHYVCTNWPSPPLSMAKDKNTFNYLIISLIINLNINSGHSPLCCAIVPRSLTHQVNDTM